MADTLTEEQLREIEERANIDTDPRHPTRREQENIAAFRHHAMDDIDALCRSLRQAWDELGQQQRTMEFWEQSYLAEHETWGSCKWKVENDVLREQLAQARAENTRLLKLVNEWLEERDVKAGYL